MTMNTGDVSRRIGVPITAELLQELRQLRRLDVGFLPACRAEAARARQVGQVRRLDAAR